MQLGIELEKPRQPVRPLEGDAARSIQVAHLRGDIRRGDALVECRSRAGGKRRVSVEARDARQEPVAVHGRMPVVAPVERGRQLARRPHVGVAVQHVGDLVGVLLVNAGERQLRGST